MSEMNFSVPYGTREMSFGIVDKEEELCNFYLIFIESVTMGLRQVVVYGDYNEDGVPMEVRSEPCSRRKDFDDEFEFEFDVSDTRKVKIYVCMTDSQYVVYVSY